MAKDGRTGRHFAQPKDEQVTVPDEAPEGEPVPDEAFEAEGEAGTDDAEVRDLEAGPDEGSPDGPGTEGGRGGKPQRSRKALVLVCLALVALLCAGGVCSRKLYHSALAVRDEAKGLMAQVGPAKEAVKSGDVTAIQDLVAQVGEVSHHIHDEVNTPLWDAACFVPYVGRDIRSVRALADALVDLSDNALTPLASNASVLDLKGIFHDGQVDVPALQALAAAFEEAAPAVSRSAEAIGALPEARLPQLAEPLEKVRGTMGKADALMEKALRVVPYLPRMLGADGQASRYLIIAQNNAESRSTGGLPGSWGVLTIVDGTFELGDFVSILHQGGLKVERRDDEAFWATNFDTDPAQVNFLADFSRVGALCSDYWFQARGEEVDGVIALDPVFLQKMLALTGPITTDDGIVLDGTNAARELMSEVYWRYGNDNDAQDEFFAQTAGLAAKGFFSNIGDAGMTTLLKTFLACAKEHRFYAWMADEEEEAMMALLGFDGKVGQDPATPELGIYLNDGTWSKISWYTRLEVEVGGPERNGDGTTTYPVRIMLTNTIGDEAAEAPAYVTGMNVGEKLDVSDMISRVYVLAPAGATVTDATVENGHTDKIVQGSCYGLEGFKANVHTPGGQTTTFTCRVTVAAEATAPLTVRATPLAQEENLVVTYAEVPQSDN